MLLCKKIYAIVLHSVNSDLLRKLCLGRLQDKKKRSLCGEYGVLMSDNIH